MANCFDPNDYIPFNGVCHVNDNISVLSTEINGFVDSQSLPCTVYVYSDNRFLGAVNLTNNINWKISIPNNFTDYLLENEHIFAKIGKGKYNFSESSNIVYVKGIVDYFSAPKTFKSTNLSSVIDFSNPLIREWADNVTNKFINGDILNNYLNKTEDLDAIFNAIATLFSLQVAYADTNTDLQYNGVLLIERYLEERNLKIPEKAKEELIKQISSKFITIFRERNTYKSILEQQGSEHKNYIAPYSYQEYIYNIIEDNNIGVNIGNNSPLFKGNSSSNRFSYPFATIKENKNNISLLNPNNIFFQDNGEIILSNNSGIGNESDFKPIIVDSNKSYKFNMKIKKSLGNDISIGFYCYDILGNKLKLRRSSDNSESNSDYFVVNNDIVNNNEYIYLECILYNSLTRPFSNTLNSFFKNQSQSLSNFIIPFRTQFIIPFIIYNGNSNCYIQDLNFSTLFREPYSFVQTNNIIELELNSEQIINKQDKINFSEKNFIPYSYHIFIDNTFKIEQAFVDITTDCSCSQEPIFVKTGQKKCIGRDLFEEYKDINSCTKKDNYWQKKNSINNVCTECQQAYSFSHETIEEKDSSEAFLYNNKLYKKKVTSYFHDGNCGYITSINYYDIIIDPCNNIKNAIWVQTSNEIMCENEDCQYGDNPVYIKEGDPICFEWDEIEPSLKWNVLDSFCLENDGIYKPVEEDWEFIDRICYEESPDCNFIEISQILISC